MALQLGALRDALIDAGATPEKADRAAEEVAAYDARLVSIEGRLVALIWAVGLNVAAGIAIFGMLFTAAASLSEISGQVAKIARTVH